MSNRKIMDNIILVEEALHCNNVVEEKGMVIKLDMANAFDQVRHAFLFKVMDYFYFNKNIIKWIREFIGAPWIAPLVNGLYTTFF